MKYKKPQIIDLGSAVTAIHGGQEKVICICVENKGSIDWMTAPAYEAEE